MVQRCVRVRHRELREPDRRSHRLARRLDDGPRSQVQCPLAHHVQRGVGTSVAIEFERHRPVYRRHGAGVPMTDILLNFERSIPVLSWMAVALVLSALGAVIVERATVAWSLARRRRLEVLYEVLLRRALDGDLGARRTLIASPSGHRLIIAALLITPLIEDRDPDRIARTREIVEGLALVSIADRYLRSWLWWRRAL